jgi:hypothetical protein
MEDQLEKFKRTKSLYLFEDMMHLWISSAGYKCVDIHVSDSISNVTYNVAEFDGYRYTIKNMQYFNDVFVKSAKIKPQIIRDVLKFIYEQNKRVDELDDFKIKFNCFRRRIYIYIFRQINKTKHILWD